MFCFRGFNKTSKISALFCIICIFLIISCTKDDQPFSEEDISDCCVFTNDYTPDINDTTSVSLEWTHPALEQMRKRAELIGKIEWIPQGEVLQRNGFFHAGVLVKGIPYSSVKELDKFVGQEVSFYTFITAVNNPRSVLYTEHVGKSPYNGINCAAYYGTVCSMAVNYALGLDRPYGTFMYGTLPFIKRVAIQDLEHAAPGDIIYFLYGHVVLITNIIKGGDGVIKYVDILEASGSRASYNRYTKTGLVERLNKYEFILYRYTDLYKLAEIGTPFPSIDFYPDKPLENLALSLNRGNMVTYREGESVVVNVLEGGYDSLVVVSENNVIKRIPFTGTPDIALDDLRAGSYEVYLVGNNGIITESVCFEVLQTEVTFKQRSNYLDIHFSSVNAIPDYIVFTNKNGGRYFIADITETDRLNGHKYVKCEAKFEDLYLKVFFRGEYGRVSNALLRMRL